MNEMDRYPQPPVTEMNIDLRVPSAGWDWTMPGQMMALVGEEYPGKIRHDNVVNIGTVVQVGVSRVVLSAEEGRWLLGMTPTSLQLHSARGVYPDWRSETLPRLERAMHAYEKVRPGLSVARLGLRYQNNVSILTRDTGDFPAWVIGLPTLPANAEQVQQVSSVMTFRLASGANSIVQIRTGDVLAAAADEVPVVIDIDTFRETADAIPMSEVFAVLDGLHQDARATFELLITDKTRARFT